MSQLRLSTSHPHYFLRSLILNGEKSFSQKSMEDLVYAILRVAQVLLPQSYVELESLQQVKEVVLGIMDTYIRYESGDQLIEAERIFASKGVLGLLGDIKKQIGPLIVPEPFSLVDKLTGENCDSQQWKPLSQSFHPFMSILYEKTLTTDQRSASVYRFFINHHQQLRSYKTWMAFSQERRALADQLIPEWESLGLKARFINLNEPFDDNDILSPWVAYRLLKQADIPDISMDGVFLASHLKDLRHHVWRESQWAQIFPEIKRQSLLYLLSKTQLIDFSKNNENEKEKAFSLNEKFYKHLDTFLFGCPKNVIDLWDSVLCVSRKRLSPKEFGQNLLQKGLGIKDKNLLKIDKLVDQVIKKKSLDKTFFMNRVYKEARLQIKYMDPDGVFKDGYMEKLERSIQDAFSCLEAAIMDHTDAKEELNEAIDCLSIEEIDFE